MPKLPSKTAAKLLQQQADSRRAKKPPPDENDPRLFRDCTICGTVRSYTEGICHICGNPEFSLDKAGLESFESGETLEEYERRCLN
jgi:hypothetical protein